MMAPSFCPPPLLEQRGEALAGATPPKSRAAFFLPMILCNSLTYAISSLGTEH